jgi:hypothetical protein
MPIVPPVSRLPECPSSRREMTVVGGASAAATSIHRGEGRHQPCAGGPPTRADDTKPIPHFRPGGRSTGTSETSTNTDQLMTMSVDAEEEGPRPARRRAQRRGLRRHPLRPRLPPLALAPSSSAPRSACCLTPQGGRVQSAEADLGGIATWSRGRGRSHGCTAASGSRRPPSFSLSSYSGRVRRRLRPPGRLSVRQPNGSPAPPPRSVSPQRS